MVSGAVTVAGICNPEKNVGGVLPRLNPVTRRKMDVKPTHEVRCLLIEPFFGGSHKQLIDLLSTLPETAVYSMSDKKWHWRSRTAALCLSQMIPESPSYRTLFASSVLNLAELVALRPDLAKLRKILYFHEHQLIYPVQKYKERDFQHGYNQILSCLVVDVVVFNSYFNLNSFIDSINTFLNAMPDYKPRGLEDKIRAKSIVIYFPVRFDQRSLAAERGTTVVTAGGTLSGPDESSAPTQLVRPLHILWPHRWEHDKNPTMFFEVLSKLKADGLDFTVSVVGESYSEIPEIFEESRHLLAERIHVWGYQEDKQVYRQVLEEADVVVSTATHEFFGVAMLEGVNHGCHPICPNRLVYPEIYPKQFLYNTEQQLYKRLRQFCLRPQSAREFIPMNLEKFSWDTLKTVYLELLYPQVAEINQKTC